MKTYIHSLWKTTCLALGISILAISGVDAAPPGKPDKPGPGGKPGAAPAKPAPVAKPGPVVKPGRVVKPGPVVVAPRVVKPAVRVVVPAPAPARVYPAVSSLAGVQRRLKDLGYYYGSVDGISGPMTRSAIRRYQADHGLAVTGEVNTPLLRSLRL